MHVHILGICGTFMGGLALLARELGLTVSGSDQNVYPPMSTQLEATGIQLYRYNAANLNARPDLVIIGNALSRGNPEVEATLNLGLAYTSGPQWLYDAVLKNRQVLAVAGTHGKTTTSAMLAWILEHAGHQPGFLIGGIPINFGCSSRLGHGTCFVIEADEYDTAFFDKRSKFVHYRPRTAILNNLEYDHADIFPDLAAIQTQFHHLVRTIPGNGQIIMPRHDDALKQVIDQGCWTPVQSFALDSSAEWHASLFTEDGSQFQIFHHSELIAEIDWKLTGNHNVSNALAAIAAAAHAGIDPGHSAIALTHFQNVKRRMELRGIVDDIHVYDDFAHHPTAISTTLHGLRSRLGRKRLIAILEPRSNTMKMGIHATQLPSSLQLADIAFIYAPSQLQWNAGSLAIDHPNLFIYSDIDDLLTRLLQLAHPGDHFVFMSNGGFANIHSRFLDSLKSRHQQLFHVEHR